MKKIFTYPLFIILSIVIHFEIIKLNIVNIYFVPVIVFFIFIGFMVLLEKIFPYRKDWNIGRGDFWTDVIQTIIILPVIAKLVEVIFVGIHNKYHLSSWSENMPFFLQAILVIAGADLLFYWYHRIAHNNKFLVKYHAVHHGAERVYWANSGRFHFIDAFLQGLFFYIPVYLFAASDDVKALFLTLNVITGTLEHSNIDYKTIVLSRIFNTAELHRIHHSTKLDECNSNYGKILSIWDTIFGTYQKPKFKREDLNVGLPFGKKVPVDLMGQIRYPFKK